MRRLEDQIGIILYRYLGSKNADYPMNSFDALKMVQCAEELADFIRRGRWK
jgi:hypothetical protein